MVGWREYPLYTLYETSSRGEHADDVAFDFIDPYTLHEICIVCTRHNDVDFMQICWRHPLLYATVWHVKYFFSWRLWHTYTLSCVVLRRFSFCKQGTPGLDVLCCQPSLSIWQSFRLFSVAWWSISILIRCLHSFMIIFLLSSSDFSSTE
jgi:hypothetical protein